MAYEVEKELMFRACAAEHGIVVATANMDTDLAAFTRAYAQERRLDAIPALEFRRSPWKPREEIWIVKVSETEKRQARGERASASASASASADDDLPPPAIQEVDLGDIGL